MDELLDDLVSEFGLGINIFQIFMIWVGYSIVRISFPLKKSPKISYTVRVGGIISLSIGCLPIDFIGYISFFSIISLVLAHYFDSNKIKLHQFPPKEGVSVEINKKSGFSLFTWDVWIVTIVCFFLATYYIMLIFASILSDIQYLLQL